MIIRFGVFKIYHILVFEYSKLLFLNFFTLQVVLIGCCNFHSGLPVKMKTKLIVDLFLYFLLFSVYKDYILANNLNLDL